MAQPITIHINAPEADPEMVIKAATEAVHDVRMRELGHCPDSGPSNPCGYCKLAVFDLAITAPGPRPSKSERSIWSWLRRGATVFVLSVVFGAVFGLVAKAVDLWLVSQR